MKTLKSIILSITLLVVFNQAKAQDNGPNVALNNVITDYLGVKNALITDNSVASKNQAKLLLAAITAVPADKFTTEKKALWTSYTNKLQFDSRHISESDAIDHQREHFASLSKNLFTVIKGLKLNTSIIYEQYCPMKKTTWLSETAIIKNPYFGKQMPTCGKTTETINPSGR